MPVETTAKQQTQNNALRRILGSRIINNLAEFGLGGAYAFLALSNRENPFKAFREGISFNADQITALGEEFYLRMINNLLEKGRLSSKIGAWSASALDGVDGARAKDPEGGILFRLFGERNDNISEGKKRLAVNPNGHLVDVGSDRRREFHAIQAINNKFEDEKNVDMAHSVALPSLMRALAEGLGFYVPESNLDLQIAKVVLGDDYQDVDYRAGTSLGRNKLIINAAYLVGKGEDGLSKGNLNKILQANLQTAKLRANPRLWRRLPEEGGEKIRKEGIKRFLFLVWQMNKLTSSSSANNDWLAWAKEKIPAFRGINSTYLNSLIENSKNIGLQEDFFKYLDNLNINLSKLDEITGQLKPKVSKKGKQVWLWDLDNTAVSFPVVGGPPSVGKISSLLWNVILGRKDIDSLTKKQKKAISRQVKDYYQASNTSSYSNSHQLKLSIDKLNYQLRTLNPGALALMIRLAKQDNVYQTIASGRSGTNPESVQIVTKPLLDRLFPLLDEEFVPKPSNLSSIAWKSIQINTALKNGATQVNLVENDLNTALALVEKFKGRNVTIHLRMTLETSRGLLKMLNIADLPGNIKLFKHFAEIELNQTEKSMQELMLDANGESLLKYFDAQAVIGYGSAFKQQQDHQATMQDMVIVVDDVQRWHQDNVLRFPEMFNTFFPNLHGKSKVKYLTELNKRGAMINYYHVYGTGTPYKIGVISKKDYLNDLQNWTNFYVAGRSQKPIIMHARPDMRGKFDQALKDNRKQAVIAALLQLSAESTEDQSPVKFTEDQLMLQILSLSYAGDSRRKLGLDANKAAKIYYPNRIEIIALYKDVVKKVFDKYGIKLYSNIFHSKVYEQPKDKQTLEAMYAQLPKALRDLHPYANISIDDLSSWKKLYHKRVSAQLSARNNDASKAQTKKGLQTTGFINSFKYVWAKIKKTLKRKKKTQAKY